MNENQKRSRRTYSDQERAAAVRMVQTLRAELGHSQGTVKRIAELLGYNPDTVRLWANRADVVAGIRAGVEFVCKVLQGSGQLTTLTSLDL